MQTNEHVAAILAGSMMSNNPRPRDAHDYVAAYVAVLGALAEHDARKNEIVTSGAQTRAVARVKGGSTSGKTVRAEIVTFEPAPATVPALSDLDREDANFAAFLTECLSEE